MPHRFLIALAALLLLTGVAAGAFGAHALKRMVAADMLAVWHTAVLYQLVHGLGMLLIAVLAGQHGAPLMALACKIMFAGVLVFSGSLYVLVLTGAGWLGAITPLGGLAFLVAWAMVAWGALRAG
ncbi:DUF423 domain-containing protein [Allopusillimonas soli]|uniref:DUF423 domain-containing protein n=1 Tax=Allopusillimonas soli TaxID=659016 RepID=A0A853FF79_9BURK|nr:DUF423 domain-containing protein [Allopusillimonas soli]NYT38342.1 DUF423 domain-containing protein [Allopusillimonas soli]TEA72088.1 DUF423 domain-containing protein [Allopusillimonas soli]